MAATVAGGLLAPAATLAAGGPPVAVTDSVTIAEDSPATTIDVLANDTDPEGDPLGLTTIGAHSRAKVTVTAVDPAAGTVSIQPAANFNGTVAVTYSVSDGGMAVWGTISISVTPVNDLPLAADDHLELVEDVAEAVTTDLLANDSDVEGPLAVTAVGSATGGEAQLVAGTVTFQPAANVCGDAAGAFDYTLADGEATDTGHATVDIECVNDAPVAVDDTATMLKDGPALDVDVAANDTDADHDALTVSDPVVDEATGTAAIAAGKVRFTPATGFTGDAVITYTVSDGHVSDTATLTVTVEADDDAPVVTAPTVTFGTGRVNESAPLEISWTGTDAGVGIDRFEVQARVGTGGWVTIYTGPDRSITRAYPFRSSLEWRVRAYDELDNVSAWTTSAVRRLVAYQGGSPVASSGTWTGVTSAGSSGTGYRYTTTEGRRATLTFNGLGVLYVAPRLSSAGYAKVSIDGTVTRHNLRSASTSLGVIVKARTWSSSGTHTIRVINDQGGRRTTLDAFVVLR